jgi:hypothetical protein
MSYWRLDRPTGWVGLSPAPLGRHRTPKALHTNKLRISISDDSPGIGRPVRSLPIQGAPDAATSSVQHVRVDHRRRRAHILVQLQARSQSCCRRTISRCCRSAGWTFVGNMVTRSFCPFPSRRSSSPREKSMSFTRNGVDADGVPGRGPGRRVPGRHAGTADRRVAAGRAGQRPECNGTAIPGADLVLGWGGRVVCPDWPVQHSTTRLIERIRRGDETLPWPQLQTLAIDGVEVKPSPWCTFFLPSRHFVSFSQAIIYRGGGFQAVWSHCLMVAAIGLAFFTYSLALFRRSIAVTR